MRYKAFKCDICGREMSENGRLVIKKRLIGGGADSVIREWQKLDVCPQCTDKMLIWIKGRKLLGKSADQIIIDELKRRGVE